MALYTAQDIIVGGLQELGLGRAENYDTTNDLQNNLPKLNKIIAQYSVDGLLIQQTLDEGFILTGGVGIYTIGLGQTPGPSVFNTSRPWIIESAYIVDSFNNHYPITLIPREPYQNEVDVQISQSRPTQLFYDIGLTDATSEIGTIKLYLIPDFAEQYTLHIVSIKELTRFVALTDTVYFDEMYMNLLEVKLAIKIARMYGKGALLPELRIQDTINEGIVYKQNWRDISLAPKLKNWGRTMNIYNSMPNN